MANSKRNTITRDSVIRRSPRANEAQVSNGPTQGIQTNEKPNRQTAVWLSDDEVDWLDQQMSEIKRGGWRSVTRSGLIRAIIQSAMKQPTDLAGVSAETEITQRLLQ